MEYECISADCHIDLIWLPPDLFTRNARAALKDRMPFVTDGPDGPVWVSRAGAQFGLANGMGSGGRKYVPGQIHRSDRMAETGLYSDGEKGIRRLTDPDLRLKDQDRDGDRDDDRHRRGAHHQRADEGDDLERPASQGHLLAPSPGLRRRLETGCTSQ